VKAEALAGQDYQGCSTNSQRGAFSTGDDDPARLERSESTATAI
jgi:hypothetical protein